MTDTFDFDGAQPAPLPAARTEDRELTVAEVFLEAGMDLPGVAYLDAPHDLKSRIVDSAATAVNSEPHLVPDAASQAADGRPLGTVGPAVILTTGGPGRPLHESNDADSRTLTVSEVVSLISLRGWAVLAALSAVAALMSFAHNEGELHSFALASAALAFALPSLAVIDIKVLRLPVVIVYPTAVVVACVSFASLVNGHVTAGALGGGLAATAAIGGYHWLLHVLTNSLGLGDVKLAALAAFVLGTQSPLLALLSVVMAPPMLMIPVLGVMAVRGQKQAPFGPALAAGAFLGLLAPGVFQLFLGSAAL